MEEEKNVETTSEETPIKDKVSSVRRSKKSRLTIIIILLIIVAIIAFFFEKTRIWMIGVAIVLLAALGLEMANTDVDVGSVLEGESVSDSVIERDAEGNLLEAEGGGFLTRVLRNSEGLEVAEGTEGAKYTDEYNCDDFDTQPEAQTFFMNAGGVSQDTNRLDGDKDGEACESLPKGTRSN